MDSLVVDRAPSQPAHLWLVDGHGNETSSAQPEMAVAFGSFADLALLPVEVPSLWRGFLPLGALTMLWGEAKSGKSTLIAGLLKALEAGQPFLGQQTRKATALWLSEEPEQALREKAEAFGLFDLKSSVAGAGRIYGVGWGRLIEQAVDYAKSRGHELLIVDTLTGLAGLDPEEENDAGAVAARLRPLKLAAAQDLAVLFVHHTNKNGRKSPRGSGAFTGLVDASISFRRPSQHSQQVAIASNGRYLESARLTATLVRDGAGWSYRLLGTSEPRSTVAEGEDADAVLWAALPVGEDRGLASDDLVDMTGLTIDQIKNRLRKWYDADREGLARSGRGAKGDPYRWYRSR